MNAIRESAFDEIAARYDAIWSDTPVGKAQRSAAWRWIDPLFGAGDFVLDLGCGTGVDALHLQSRGVSVYGIDDSPKMIEVARDRGVRADCCPIEHLQDFNLNLDGVISNFGALNCLSSLTGVAAALARMVRPGGYLALCFMGRICLWESAFYLLRAQPAKAVRRFKGRAVSSLSASVFYPSCRAIVSAFQNSFRLINFCGIGFSVPPSYVTFLSREKIDRLSALDSRLAHQPVLRSLADHRLYIFKRT